MTLKIGAMVPELVRHLFRRPATVLYPFEKFTLPQGFRGKPVMDPMLCIGCRMCERDCPAEAIEIHEDPDTPPPAPEPASSEPAGTDAAAKPFKPKRQFYMVYYLDRCTHCAQCAETCPRKAIVMDGQYEDAAFSRDALRFVYKIQRATPGGPQQS